MPLTNWLASLSQGVQMLWTIGHQYGIDWRSQQFEDFLTTNAQRWRVHPYSQTFVQYLQMHQNPEIAKYYAQIEKEERSRQQKQKKDEDAKQLLGIFGQKPLGLRPRSMLSMCIF